MGHVMNRTGTRQFVGFMQYTYSQNPVWLLKKSVLLNKYIVCLSYLKDNIVDNINSNVQYRVN